MYGNAWRDSEGDSDQPERDVFSEVAGGGIDSEHAGKGNQDRAIDTNIIT